MEACADQLLHADILYYLSHHSPRRPSNPPPPFASAPCPAGVSENAAGRFCRALLCSVLIQVQMQWCCVELLIWVVHAVSVRGDDCF